MELPGGRVYPLKSLGYENQRTRSYASFPPSTGCYCLLRYSAALFTYIEVFTERCGSVRFGVVRFAYIGAAAAKSQPK